MAGKTYEPRGEVDATCRKKIDAAYRRGYEAGNSAGSLDSYELYTALKNLVTLVKSGMDLQGEIPKILIEQAWSAANQHEHYSHKIPKDPGEPDGEGDMTDGGSSPGTKERP